MPVSKRRKLSKKKVKSLSRKMDKRYSNLKFIRNDLYEVFSRDLLELLDERLRYLDTIDVSTETSVLDFTKMLNTSNSDIYKSLQVFKRFTDTEIKVISPDTGHIENAKDFFKSRYTRIVGNFMFTIMDIHFDTCFNKALSYISSLNITKDNVLSLIEESKTAHGIGEYVFIRAMVFSHCKLLLDVGFDIESFKLSFYIPTFIQVDELLHGYDYGVMRHVDIFTKELNDLLVSVDFVPHKKPKDIEVKEDTFVDELETIQFKYIDSYLKLNKLAESMGFIKIRSNGDHAIFRDCSGKTVVIPQGRTIGKGLSFTIQSSIY